MGNWNVQHQPIKWSINLWLGPPDGMDDVPGTIHTGGAQPESDHAALSVPPMESARRNLEFNKEEEEQVEGTRSTGCSERTTPDMYGRNIRGL